MQMQRFNRYQQFRDKVNKIYRKISLSHCNPLGADVVKGIRRAEAEYAKLNEKWQSWIDKRVGEDMVQYHKPIVKGRSGQWWSQADMDRWHMNH